MPMTLEEIVEETAQWPDETVTLLIERLSHARHPEAPGELSEEWKATLDRRYEEIKSGQVKTLTLNETRAIVRKTVGL